MTIINALQPRSILDVGCGFGKYGMLLREYLDVWHERYDKERWQVRIVGIEAFEQYRNPFAQRDGDSNTHAHGHAHADLSVRGS